MPRSKSSLAVPSNERVFYTAGFDKVVTMPIDAVVQMPKCQAKRLVLCTFFDPNKPFQSCPLKKKCNFVHADIRRATQIKTVHVNYAWRQPNDVFYERFPTGTLLEVAPPGCKHVVDTMDSSLALKTKALGSTRLPLQHCAHYYYTLQCDLGSECMFVHAVFIDPDAAPLQRAPVPRDMGRGREHLKPPPPPPSVMPTSSPSLDAIVDVEIDQTVVSLAPSVDVGTAGGNSDSGDATPVVLRRPSSSSDVGVDAAGISPHKPLQHSGCGSPLASPSPLPAAGRVVRYRHDPYQTPHQTPRAQTPIAHAEPK